MRVYNLKPKESFIGIKKYNSAKNKICVSRKCGGFGDILVARMIFEDIKNNYPEFEITFALPPIFHQVASNHQFIDKLEDCNQINFDDYISVYDITHTCSAYESSLRQKCDKHRSDIWAESIGIKLAYHNMHLPGFENYKSKIYDNWKKLGWNENKKIIALTPKSAVQIRNLPDEMISYILKKFKRDDVFIFILNHIPIINFSEIPYCRGANYLETMAILSFVDGLISTDTGTLHCAGGYQKPVLGIFNYTNGELISRYYNNTIVVQKTKNNDPNWNCGPCNDYSKCPFEIINHVLQCSKEINNKMLDEGISSFMQKIGIDN